MRRQRRHREDLDDEGIEGFPTGRAREGPSRQVGLADLVDDSNLASAVRAVSTADEASRNELVQSLQRRHGNDFVRGLISALDVRQRHRGGTGGGSGAGGARGDTITLEREEEEPEPADATNEAEQLADIPEGVTEEVGPTTSSSYAVAATSLSDVASQLASRDEAGYCGWKESWNFKTGPTGRITAVKVTVKIDIEMPAWTPPPSMLPKTKAEWERSYQALLAHERGHEKLVHDYFDGLANKILGKTARQGRQLFDGAKSGLAAASKAYDAKTGNGTKTGTIIDTTIEQRELAEKKKEEEEKRKKAAAEKAGRKAEADTEGGEPAETPA